MSDVVLSWCVLSLIVLFFQTVKDLRSMTVDERYNYLLMGYALFSAVSVGLSLGDILVLTAVSVVLGVAMRRSGVLAKGDQQAVYTLLLGNYATEMLVVFLLLLCTALLTAYLTVKLGRYGVSRIPAFPLILVAQAGVCGGLLMG